MSTHMIRLSGNNYSIQKKNENHTLHNTRFNWSCINQIAKMPTTSNTKSTHKIKKHFGSNCRSKVLFQLSPFFHTSYTSFSPLGSSLPFTWESSFPFSAKLISFALKSITTIVNEESCRRCFILKKKKRRNKNH